MEEKTGRAPMPSVPSSGVLAAAADAARLEAGVEEVEGRLIFIGVLGSDQRREAAATSRVTTIASAITATGLCRVIVPDGRRGGRGGLGAVGGGFHAAPFVRMGGSSWP